MDVLEAIKSRNSVRGYKSIPVAKDMLKEIIEIACRAPSDVNVQPWEITVVTGEVLDNIKRGNIDKLTSGEVPNPEVPHHRYEGKYRQRQRDLAVQLFGLMGIARDDVSKRTEWRQRGFRFFDAPAAIILSTDKSIPGLRSQFDVGSITYAICLAALSYGLGTCIEDQGVSFPDVIRKYVNIPDYKRIVIGIAIGYPDWDFPANRLQSEREPVDHVINWCGFG
ncbi:nitroreductase [Chloroflexota bacterium]